MKAQELATFEEDNFSFFGCIIELYKNTSSRSYTFGRIRMLNEEST